jgi:hypothetical protein
VFDVTTEVKVRVSRGLLGLRDNCIEEVEVGISYLFIFADLDSYKAVLDTTFGFFVQCKQLENGIISYSRQGGFWHVSLEKSRCQEKDPGRLDL